VSRAEQIRNSKSQIRNYTAWSRLILIPLGIVAGLFLAEGVLVFVLPPLVVWHSPQERYQNHPTRLFELRPSQQAFTHDKPTKINALGLRGRDVAIPKPASIYRIVVIGDSVTFGNGVGDDETYSAQLERMVRETGLRDVEVINAGIPAYDTWQQALLLEELILSLEPNLVLLGFYENDISSRPSAIRPIIGQNGEPPRRGLGAWLGDRWIALLKKSRVLVLGREAYGRARTRWNPSPAAVRRTALLDGGRHPALEAGWKEVDDSLQQMSGLLRRARIPFRIVIFPMPEQVWNREANTSAYQGRLEGITREIRVPALDLLPAFKKAAADGRTLYIFWDWHPNAEGHKVAARTIRTFISPVVAQWMAKTSIPHSSQERPTASDSSRPSIAGPPSPAIR
jgi:lysophospholipase L1-like esterase